MLYSDLIVFLLRHEGYCTLSVPLNGITRAERFSERESDERSSLSELESTLGYSKSSMSPDSCGSSECGLVNEVRVPVYYEIKGKSCCSKTYTPYGVGR